MKRLLFAATIILLLTTHRALAVDTQYESASFDFLQAALQDASGGIYANYLTSWPADPNAGVNHQMLSEYAGIAMEYAVYANKQNFFTTQDNFVQTYLQNHPDQSDLNLYSWRINAALNNPAESSATIDDFRIIDGYLQAAGKWGGTDYQTLALAAADDIKTYTMRNGIISEAGSWDTNGVYDSDTAILSYFDLPAMQRLAALDSSWTAIEQSHYDLISASATDLGNNGLYRLRYNIDGAVFIEDTSLDTIHQAIIAQHLAESGHATLAQQSLDFFETEYNANGGQIFGAYTPDGTADSPYEDISIYAILASTAMFLGDDTFATQLFDKITSLQVSGTNSIYDGGFLWCDNEADCSNPNVSRVYAFVQLQALRALAQANPVAVEEVPEDDPPVINDPDDPIENPDDPEDTPNDPDDTIDDPNENEDEDDNSDNTNEDNSENGTVTKKITITKARYSVRSGKLLVRATTNYSKVRKLRVKRGSGKLLGRMKYNAESQTYQFKKTINKKKLPKKVKVISSRGHIAKKTVKIRRKKSS